MLTLRRRVGESIRIRHDVRGTVLGALLVALAAAGGSVPAAPASPLGFYLGGAVGQGNVRGSWLPVGGPLGFDEHDRSWKLVAGLRPIPWLGAELEYIDFGHPSGSVFPYQVGARVKGPALFGLAYWPLRLPLLDLYGKAGLGRLQSTVTFHPLPPYFCAIPEGCPSRFDRTDTRFVYGAGGQIKLARFAFRAEYDRVSASGGDPDLFSLGVTWTFH